MIINCTFGDGPMGMTITKNNLELAVVSRLLPSTPAQLSGIEVGDIIVGISKRKVDNYDEIMNLIMKLQRPLLLTFKRVIEAPLLHNSHLPVSIPLAVALSNNSNFPLSARKSSPGPIYSR
jgi:S1-C subfamily serine protease